MVGIEDLIENLENCPTQTHFFIALVSEFRREFGKR